MNTLTHLDNLPDAEADKEIQKTLELASDSVAEIETTVLRLKSIAADYPQEQTRDIGRRVRRQDRQILWVKVLLGVAVVTMVIHISLDFRVRQKIDQISERVAKVEVETQRLTGRH